MYDASILKAIAQQTSKNEIGKILWKNTSKRISKAIFNRIA